MTHGITPRWSKVLSYHKVTVSQINDRIDMAPMHHQYTAATSTERIDMVADLSNLLTTLSPLIKQQQGAAIKRLSRGGRISRDISALQSFCIIAVSGFPDSRASEGVVIRIARAGNQF